MNDPAPVFGLGSSTPDASPPTSPPPAPRLDPDLDLGEDEEVRQATVLDELRAELATPVEDATITLPVANRPGYSVRFAASLDYENELVKWRKQATTKGRRGNPDTVNEFRLAGIVLGHKCQVILRHGDELELDGEPLTFRHPALQELTGTSRAVDCIRAFYGSDGHVIDAADAIVARAGYGGTGAEEVDDDEDPTIR